MCQAEVDTRGLVGEARTEHAMFIARLFLDSEYFKEPKSFQRKTQNIWQSHKATQTLKVGFGDT
jgi:hypothetical protein